MFHAGDANTAHPGRLFGSRLSRIMQPNPSSPVLFSSWLALPRAQLVAALLFGIGSALACGGKAPEPTSAASAPLSQAGTPTAAAPSSSPGASSPTDVAAAGLSKRESQVQQALAEAKAEPEEEPRGRKAMLALARTEKSHLPAAIVRLLESAADSATKPADFQAQVMEAVGKPPLSEGLEDLCGRPAATVLGDLQKVDAKKRMEKLYSDCKLGRRIKFAEPDLARLNAASVLLVLAAREFMAKHDALIDTHEELIKLGLFAFAQKK